MVALSHLSLEDTPTPPTTRSLPDIPLDVARILATFLTLDSARSLARTCRALRDVGEIRIYRDLDLTAGGDRSGLAAFPLDADGLKFRRNLVSSKLVHFVRNLHSLAFRLSNVKWLRVEPTNGANSRMESDTQAKVLRAVASQLKRLDVLPMPGRPYSSGTPTSSSLDEEEFFGILRTLGVKFPQLLHIRYAHPIRACIPIAGWILQAPNLEEIHICSAERAFGPPFATINTPSQLLRLRKITIENVELHIRHDSRVRNLGLDILCLLLSIAPNVERVRLEGSWSPHAGDAALKALGEAKSLKTFVGWDSPENLVVSGNRGIRVAKLGKALLPCLEEVAVGPVKWDELSEQDVCSDLIIPTAPALKRMTYFVSPGSATAEYASIPLGLSPRSTRHLSLQSIHRMRRAPLLISILFLNIESPIPSIYSADSTESELFIDPSRWIAEGHRGIVIREYRNETDEFWHVKVLSRAVGPRDGNRKPHVAVKRYLNHLAQFRGRTVPRWVLDAVYAASGDDVDSMEGGRALILGGGKAAWSILEEWRETVGDESDVEEGFGVAGMDVDYDVDSDSDEE